MNSYISHSVEVVDDYLAHYGVLGMKWGVRRGQARQSIKTAKKEKRSTLKGLRKEKVKNYTQDVKDTFKMKSLKGTPLVALRGTKNAKKIDLYTKTSKLERMERRLASQKKKVDIANRTVEAYENVSKAKKEARKKASVKHGEYVTSEFLELYGALKL